MKETTGLAAERMKRHTLIHHFLEESSVRFPDKIALVQEETRATYREINSQANQLAKWLIAQGVLPGDRVVLILGNGLEYVVGYYGALKTGAVAVPLNHDIKPSGLQYFLSELSPKAVISSSYFEKTIQETGLDSYGVQILLMKSPKLKWASSPFSIGPWDFPIKGGEASNPNLSIPNTALASIIYTSGSTGKPKGVMLSHKNLVANVHSICEYLHLTKDDIQMVVLPFFYVMGKSLLNTHFAVGGTIVINNKFAFPAAVVEQMAREKVTGFSGVPSIYALLLQSSPLARYRDRLPSLRYCSQAGGHMSAEIKEELRRVLPEHTRIYIMYGATEAGARLSYLEPGCFEGKKGSIGKAIPGVTLRVIGENGKDAAVGEVGELVAAGDNIMQGYWKDPEATTKVLDHFGYHTGDLSYRDEEGFFFIVGRKDNMLKVGGHRINPQEIEDVIMETKLAREVAVIGVPDCFLGNKLIALVTPKTGLCRERDILTYCAARLSKYKVPSKIQFIRSLPKSANQKIDRAKCGEMIATD